MQNTEEVWRLVDAKAPDAIELSDRVWGMPELCYAEKRSCAEHTAMLEQQGFRVTREVAGIPTAVHYPIPLNKQPAVADAHARLPVGDVVAQQVISLPMGPHLSAEDQEQVVRHLPDLQPA